MLDWSLKFRENNSYWIEAHDDISFYMFSSHALDRLFDRTTNMKSTGDLEKPIRRIVKCLNNHRVDDWIMDHSFGTKLVIHDRDINMVYVVICKTNRYDVVSTFNEFWTPFINYQRTPELWVSLM